MSNSELPNDVINDILLRLPVKSLLRFKSVCKAWGSLISSNNFIKKHLNHRSQDQLWNQQKLSFGLDWGSKPSVDLTPQDLEAAAAASGVKVPLRDTPFKNMLILGSCDGLLCVGTFNHPPDLALWNPSTRECKKLPTPNPPLDFSRSYFGLGYDSTTDDYKVLRIYACYSIYHLYGGGPEDPKEYHVDIYSLKSDSWKTVKEHHLTMYIIRYLRSPVSLYVKERFPVTLNGSFYWPAGYDYDNGSCTVKVARFDLSVEKFRLDRIPLSGSCVLSDNTHIRLELIRGSLAVLLFHDNPRQVDIWTMEEEEEGNNLNKSSSSEQPANNWIHDQSMTFSYCADDVIHLFSMKKSMVQMYGLVCYLESKGPDKYYVLYDVYGSSNLEKHSCSHCQNKYYNDMGEKTLYIESLVSPHPKPLMDIEVAGDSSARRSQVMN